MDEVEQTSSDAENVLAAAREEAAAILRAASAEAEAVREAALRNGYESGIAELAAEDARRRSEWDRRQAMHDVDCERRMTELESLAASIQAERSSLLQRALQPLPVICAEIVQTLLCRELELAPANIESMVQDMLRYVLDSAKVEIHVNPADYSIATAAHPVWQSAKYGSWELVIVPDQSIQPGGCELRSDVGRLDGTIEVKLALLQRELDAVFGRDESSDGAQ